MNLSLHTLIEKIDAPHRIRCHDLLDTHFTLFEEAMGSAHNHQAWRGGYFDHVTEVMNLAVILYKCLNGERDLPFSLSDALLVLFLHDIEKPWRWRVFGLRDKESRATFRNGVIAGSGIILTSAQENAIRFVEGENDEYSNQGRTMGELAAFCHVCDVLSARLWYDYPKTTDR